MASVSPVPQISIFLAPPEDPIVEPYSPFSATGPTTPESPDAFRPTLLSPPPTLSPQFPRQLSPLRPADSPVKGHGLERERFEAMLRASKERNALVGSKKSPDLRKEIALKVHKSKQLERRALFLSKVQAPPSPTSTLEPKTPPESPAIFHYSLPSPGLESPLAVFETLVTENPNMPPRRTWVEQVDFRIPGHFSKIMPRSTPVSRRKKLPTLDEISARLSFQAQVSAAARDVAPQPPVSPRLPAFLQSGTRSPPRSVSPPSEPTAPVPAPRRALPAAVGRLHFPVREPAVEIHSPTPRLPPSPTLAQAPKLQITTTVVPCTSSHSPTDFTESNLRALAECSRERTANNMLARLRRRTLTPSETFARGHVDEEERKLRRRSAPPELPLRERVGFSAPKLNLPGAF